MKKALKIVLIALGVVLIFVLINVIVISVNSPGRLDPLKDAEGNVIEGAIADRHEVAIGGIEQGFFVRSENPENPVILFLHGGPGSPELPMVIPMEKEERLEKYFTVCYWDQRGAGMSYSDDLDPAQATVEQFVEDTREMTELLMEMFGKDKIYLMGHSWGSYLGIKVIEKYPEYYNAYIGIGQVTHQHLSEQVAYGYMLATARENGDKGVVKNLEKFDPASPDFPSPEYLMGPRTTTMNKYGIGIMHADFSMSELVKYVMMFRGYTMSEKGDYAKGGAFSLDHVFYYVIEDNLFESSREVEVPVYVMHGKYDYQVSYALAKMYVDILKAPDKSFITFENSAHSPNLEEPERFVREVRRVAEEHP